MANAIWQKEGDGNQFRITTGTFPITIPADPVDKIFVLDTTGPRYIEDTGVPVEEVPDLTPRAPISVVAPSISRSADAGRLICDIGVVDCFPPPASITVQLQYNSTNTFPPFTERGLSGNNYYPVSADLAGYLRLQVTVDNGVAPTLVHTSAVFGQVLVGDIGTPPVVIPVAIPGGIPNQNFAEDTGNQTFAAAGGFSGQSLTYSIAANALGATINSGTGVVTVPTTDPASATQLTITATNSAGSVTNTVNVSIQATTVGVYTIPANKWTTAQNFEGAVGRREVFVEADQPMVTGKKLVWYGGPSAVGIPEQSREIIPGVKTVTTGVMAVGAVNYSHLYWRTGADPGPYTYDVAVAPKNFTIVQPTTVPQIAATDWTLTEKSGRAEFLVAAGSPITKSGGDTASDNGSVQFRVTAAQVPYFPWVQVHLPAGYDANPNTRYPVIYYLNGQGAALRTPFLFAALINAAAIVVSFDCDDVNDNLPNGGNGWYVNANPAVRPGLNWTNFFLDELIPYIDATYRTAGPGRRIVMGNSMGAYGAMNAVAERPEAFCAVAPMSGGVYDYTDAQYNGNFMQAVLGAYNDTIWNRWKVIPRLQALIAAGRTIPPIYVTVGPGGANGDVFDPVQRFRAQLNAIGVPHQYSLVASNDHSFGAPRDGSVLTVPWALAIANANPSNNSAGITIPSGHTLRGSFGLSIPDPANDSNTFAITPGVALQSSTALSPGQTGYGALWWRRTADAVHLRADTAAKFISIPNANVPVTVVSSSTTLYNAIVSMGSGEVHVAPGNYPNVQKLIGVNKPNGLRIRPLDRNNPPVFTGDAAFFLQGCSGLIFDGLTFAPTSRNTAGFHVGTPPDAMLDIQWWSSNITVINCLFDGANFNTVLRRASNCYVAYNTFKNSPQDYIRIYEDNNGHIIEFNDFQPHLWDYANYPNAHADAIQGTVTGTNTAPKNLIIRKNKFREMTRGNEVGADAWATHNMFFGNNRMVGGFGSTALGGNVYNTPGAYYENILVEDNWIEGSHPNGFGIQGVVGLTVRRNIFRRMAGTPDTSSTYCPMLNMYFAGTAQANRNVVASQNIFAGPRIWTTEGSGSVYAAGASSFTDNIFNDNTSIPSWWAGTQPVGRYGYNNGVPI